MNKEKDKDAFKKFGGDFKNETQLEEELAEEDIDLKEAEKKHFDEEAD